MEDPGDLAQHVDKSRPARELRQLPEELAGAVSKMLDPCSLDLPPDVSGLVAPVVASKCEAVGPFVTRTFAPKRQMLLKLKRTPGLYLIGFMGSGKSAVGRLLADELGWSFADIDEDIENAQGVSIAEIFDTRGEETFREIETAALVLTRAWAHVSHLRGDRLSPCRAVC